MRFLFFFVVFYLYGKDPLPQFEGVWKASLKQNSHLENDAHLFLPFNPTIVVLFGSPFEKIRDLSEKYPFGKIYLFEPRKDLFSKLEKEIADFSNVEISRSLPYVETGVFPLFLYEDKSSPLKPLESVFFSKTEEDFVSSIALSDWMEEKKLSKVDYIEIDMRGFELQMIQSAPSFFREAKVIRVKSYLDHYWYESHLFYEVKKALENLGFHLISHWFFEGKEGSAVFIEERIYDAIFH